MEGLFGNGEHEKPEALAGFDSSTTLVRALSNSLRGEDFPALGTLPRPLTAVLPYGNYLPRGARAWLYKVGSSREGIDPDELGNVDVDRIRAWFADRYPTRGYPAVVIGSANGAGVHLAALLGIPWLPQTFLLPVRRDLDPDDPRADCAWGRDHAGPLLDANPDISLHHMSDPNQDRLPLSVMAYFRVKLRELGEPYRDFLDTVLAPGGTIILSECTLTWPTTEIGDRHVFQFGCIGGLGPEDYASGSDRIARFLARDGSERTGWDPPETDTQSRESEWGFEPSLGEDVQTVVEDRGYRVCRLRHDHPRALAAPVADFYREIYTDHGLSGNRLLATTFAQTDPWWALRTGSVPYWLSFTSEADASALDKYVREAEPGFEEIYLSLFSHGVESIGLAPGERWESILDRARQRGRFVGVDPTEFPLDYGSYVRYNADIPREIENRQPIVAPVSLDRFEAFLEEAAYDGVEWIVDRSIREEASATH